MLWQLITNYTIFFGQKRDSTSMQCKQKKWRKTRLLKYQTIVITSWVDDIINNMLLLYASYVHKLPLREYRCHGHERPQNCLFIATNVTCVGGPNVSSFSTECFFFQNLVLYIYIYIWILGDTKSFQIQYLPHFKAKFYEIYSIESYSLRSFQQHQRHRGSQILWNSQLWFFI
jgi:hypothetical protein